jgi:metal-responsive CopG/Arc/MetJ family transcriptional regulator
MKTIQITMDEELLAKLDRDLETQRDGRSAVLRRAAAEYLKRRRHRDIAAGYQKAYGNKPGLGNEFDGWENEGRWPSE